MSRLIGFLGLLIGGAVLAISLAPAQRPSSSPEDRIRAALEGELTPKDSGDGLLDDVLGVIRERGSLLDGSVLDEQSSVPEDSDGGKQVSRQAFAAEQLLKAARLLEQVAPANSGEKLTQERIVLVKRMRAEAVHLLSE